MSVQAFFGSVQRLHRLGAQARACRPLATSADAAARERLLAFAEKHGIHSSSSWRNTSVNELREAGLGELLAQYGSKRALLSAALPEAVTPRDAKGSTTAKRRTALEALKEQHRIELPQEWCKVTQAEIRAACGRAALDRFGSIADLLKDAYPELQGVPDSVLQSPTRKRGYWKEQANRAAALKEIGERLGVREVSDWKNVQFKDIRREGGGSLMNHYNNSVFAMLKDLHPEEELEERHCRKNMPHSYWASVKNRRQFMENVAKTLDVHTAADWGRVSCADVSRLGGVRLLQLHGDSVFQAIQDLFPELGMQEQHRARAKKGHWDSCEEARRFLDDFAKAKGIHSPGQWRTVVEEDLKAAGGGTLLKKHSSLFALLCFAYPTEQWDALECRHRLPVDYWSDDEHVKSFMRSLVSAHDIRDENDWLRISHEQVREAGGGGLLKRMPLLEAAAMTFPDLELSGRASLTNTKKRAIQGTLLRQLRGLIIPNEVVATMP